MVSALCILRECVELLAHSVEPVARHVRVPVRERAERIVLPRPHVQRVERREPEAVRRIEEVKELSVQLGRMRMMLVSVRCKNQIVRAGVSQSYVRSWIVH